MRAVKVHFHPNNKGYWYLVGEEYSEFELPVGTNVVVNSPYSGLTVVKVAAVNNDTLSQQAKECIVDVVDTSYYDQRKTNAARRLVIKQELEKKANELLELKKYEILAEDEEGKKLLEEPKKLS